MAAQWVEWVAVRTSGALAGRCAAWLGFVLLPACLRANAPVPEGRVVGEVGLIGDDVRFEALHWMEARWDLGVTGETVTGTFSRWEGSYAGETYCEGEYPIMGVRDPSICEDPACGWAYRFWTEVEDPQGECFWSNNVDLFPLGAQDHHFVRQSGSELDSEEIVEAGRLVGDYPWVLGALTEGGVQGRIAEDGAWDAGLQRGWVDWGRFAGTEGTSCYTLDTVLAYANAPEQVDPELPLSVFATGTVPFDPDYRVGDRWGVVTAADELVVFAVESEFTSHLRIKEEGGCALALRFRDERVGGKLRTYYWFRLERDAYLTIELGPQTVAENGQPGAYTLYRAAPLSAGG